MTDENYPQDVKYTREHDWVRLSGDEAVFGITWFAQDALGEIVYADMPKADITVTAGQTYGELESVKAVSDVYAPLSGVVLEANPHIDEEPGAINDDCYGQGWLVRVRLTDQAEVESLLEAAAYVKFLATA